MRRNYDVTIKSKNGSTISYWADSFSIYENGLLKINSKECGNISVLTQLDEEVFVRSVDTKDEYND